VRSSIARLIGAYGHARIPSSGLGRLPEGWQVVNDVPVEETGARIDHVLVGPAGVFALSVKNLTGTVWIGASGVRVNGHATDYLQTSRHDAHRATRLLSEVLDLPVDVRPVIAILADGWTVQEPPTDVFIGPPRGVKDWLCRLSSVLSPRDVAAIAAAAARLEP